MGYELGFIGLGMIVMVDQIVGEVEGDPKMMDLESKRSSEVGMRVPQILPSISFMEPSLFHFLPRAPLFFHFDRAVLGWNHSLIKG